MATLEESVITSAAPKKVWRAWSEMYHWKTLKSKKNGVKEGFIIEKNGKRVPFKIIDIKKFEHFTTIWKSLFVKMKFKYEVKSRTKGSIISCKVYFAGIFGWATSIFLKKKIKKDLVKSLSTFADQLDMSKNQKKRFF